MIDDNLYDVKFYPYATLDDDQIFAVTGERDLFICRSTIDADPPFELLRWFKEDDVSRVKHLVGIHSFTEANTGYPHRDTPLTTALSGRNIQTPESPYYALRVANK